ncbi:peptide/nickel transport system substrate-binding protein [Nonomuraea polychroma]|uniref:Peptide/nickel transport system substrate-binding protein n=1 Tax=Nonomuraea polychroma TaxID=46176 RepID=A0A438M7P5_9ACTN|nr:ABC transporter family substrate-binding protein [Nonomuraea polychroma]RVX41743.1 peptide/nickel transport system substrate-binding protein [Nonomuraea polychroma]
MSHRHRFGRFLAAVAGGALLLSACGQSGGGQASKPSASAAGAAQTITYAGEQEFNSYNSTAVNNLVNSTAMQRVLAGFWYYGQNGVVTPDKDFGTYTKSSDDPLTVDYEFNSSAVWSDGTPIDCDDALLFWAAKSGKVKGFQVDGTSGVELVKAPACKAGDKKFTFEYSEPFADWDSNGPGAADLLPAHVAYKAAGMSEADFIAAVQAEDAKKLEAVIKFYNEGWVIEGGIKDMSLFPASGPYKISAMEPGQSLTLTANDKWWGPKPATPTIVMRVISQEEQAQALQNREVNLIEPQPNPDLLAQLEGMQGVTVKTGDQYTYEHLDFNFEGAFKDKALREAFAKCVPRQLIVDNLIKPLAPQAQVLQARTKFPFEADYATVAQGNGAENYAQPDIEGAKALLEKAGKAGMEVKIGHNLPNPRRTQEVQLIADSCGKAGFKIVDAGDEKFFEAGGPLATNTYDVALFAWSGSAEVSQWSSTYTTAKECSEAGKENNNGCYSNKEVDELIKKLNGEVDKTKHPAMIAEIEKLLWTDLATIPLFAHPGMLAWDEKLQGIVPNPAQSSVTWNMDKWTLAP